MEAVVVGEERDGVAQMRQVGVHIRIAKTLNFNM